jgi:superfamily I DNA/RNA helicase
MTQLFLVHGPPGTGKTYYLSRQCERAVAEHGASNVAIASLTRTAANEIAGRTNLDDHLVGTLHAHAFHALERPDLAETPEGIRAFNEAYPAHRLTGGGQRLEDTLAAADTEEQATAGDQLHNQVMTLRAKRVPRDTWTDLQLEHDQVWEDFKRHTSRLDFTDLIEKAIAETDIHPANPRVWLFDEAQDFSPLELQLAVHWARHADTAVIVADPDQAIYGWRGADPAALYALDFAGERVLQQSRRVCAAAHHTATRWINLIDDRRPVTWNPTDVGGQVAFHGGATRAPEAWLPDLVADLEQGLEVMVLTSCGYMLTPLINVLRRHGVPFHNEYRPERGQWNPLRGARRLKAFLRPDPRLWGDKSRSWTWQDLHDWTEPLKAKGTLTRGSKSLIESKITEDRFGESQANAEVPWETLMMLFEDAGPRHPAIRLDVQWWQDHLLASQAKSAAYPVEVLKRQGHEALREKPRLTIGTIHSVKGGQADVVYMAPDLSSTGMAGWDSHGPARDQIIRMFYVALTRARQRVHILAPSGPTRVPRQLFDLPEVAFERNAA